MVLAILLLLSLFVAAGAAGQVPGAADFAACNEEAPRSVKAGTVTATMADYLHAVNARSDGATTSPPAPALDSVDPQIRGMEAEGARSAMYQAAYRSCMSRRGF